MEALNAEVEAEAEAAPVPAQIPAATRTPTQAHTFAQMRLKVGDSVHLEPPRRIAGGRASVIMLGWLEGHSVIVTAPRNDAGCLVLQEGELVLMRAFTGKSAFAFRTAVLKVAYQPFHYVHLSFPDKVEGAEIRSSPRCRLSLPAVISPGGRAAGQGSILNIGTTGALIQTAGPLDRGEGGSPFLWSCTVPVSLDLCAQVCGTKSVAAPDGTSLSQYGVEFRDLQPNDRLILGSLVWYQMYEHPRCVT